MAAPSRRKSIRSKSKVKGPSASAPAAGFAPLRSRAATRARSTAREKGLVM